MRLLSVLAFGISLVLAAGQTSAQFGWWNPNRAEKDGEGLWSQDGGFAFLQPGIPDPDALIMRVDTACVGLGGNCFRYWIGQQYDSDDNAFLDYTSSGQQATENTCSYEAAGVEVADIDAQGDQTDAIFFTVDVPNCNAGNVGEIWYRVGRDLLIGGDGAPTFSGGFSNVQRFGSVCTRTDVGVENNCGGGGAALANLNANPAPDVLLSTNQNIAGNSYFEWYVGFDLDASGVFQGGITPKRSSQGIALLGAESDGGGVSFINADGNLLIDAVFMGISDPGDQFRWRIAYDIGANGIFGSWSNVFSHGALGWYSDGGGLDAQNLDEVTTDDAVFMTIDRPLGNNWFWFYGAHNLVRGIAVEVAHHAGGAFPAQVVRDMVDQTFLRAGVRLDWRLEEEDALACPRDSVDTYSEFSRLNTDPLALNLLWVSKLNAANAPGTDCNQGMIQAGVLGSGYSFEFDPNPPTPIAETGTAVFVDEAVQFWEQFRFEYDWDSATECILQLQNHVDFPPGALPRILCAGNVGNWPDYNAHSKDGPLATRFLSYLAAHEMGHLFQAPHPHDFLPAGDPEWEGSRLPWRDLMEYPWMITTCGTANHLTVRCPSIAPQNRVFIALDRLDLGGGQISLAPVIDFAPLWGTGNSEPRFHDWTGFRLDVDQVVSIHTNDFQFVPPVDMTPDVSVPRRGVLGFAPSTEIVTPWGIAFGFAKIPGSPKISFEGFDIDSSTEMKISVNGGLHSYVPTTADMAWGSTVTVSLSDANVFDSARNRVQFAFTGMPAWDVWALRNFNVGPTIVLPPSVDQTLAEDTTRDNAFDLDIYAYEVEGDPRSFVIESVSDPNCGVTIDGNNFVDIAPTPDWNGQCIVTTRVSDGALTNTDSFTITVTPMPEVPSAPQSLAASRGNAQVILAWLEPANNGGASITNYRIFRRAPPGAEGFLIEIGNLLTHTDAGLANGQQYCYRIKAKNIVGEGPMSNEACAVPATTPSAPLSLVATPGKHQVDLAWAQPASTGGDPITKYRVFRRVPPSPIDYIIAEPTGTSYTDTGRFAGIQYCYRISAINSVGEGPKSAEACAVPFALFVKERGVEWTGFGDATVNDVHAADVDSDGIVEVLAVGETIGLSGLRKAQLRILNGETFALEAEWVWPPDSVLSFFHGVIAHNVDSDPEREILAVGSASGGFIWCFFSWNGITLLEEGCTTYNVGSGVLYAVHLANLGGGPAPEWIVAGQRTDMATPQGYLQFGTWGNDGTPITDTKTWAAESEVGAYDVYAAQVDSDSQFEILTAGFTRPSASPTRFGQLRVWKWMGQGNFQSEEHFWQWQSGGSTEALDVYARHLDADNVVDIIVCGYTHDGVRERGELRRYDVAPSLTFQTGTTWYDISTRCSSVHAANLDNDALIEIVTGGWTTKAAGTYAELRLWTFGFSTKATQHWRENEAGTQGDAFVNAVVAAEVDRDGVVEVVSGGKVRPLSQWWAQTRVWFDP